jgi:hypothetical protein
MTAEYAPIIKVCGWCPEGAGTILQPVPFPLAELRFHFFNGRVVEASRLPPGGPEQHLEISHGICPDCAARERK